ncbi:ABC transporter ATP-binding protein [Campylobacter corcagiensis]|uniref:ABC transporter ATP-binding protein n=1 Tax=Campylobacter corcagiensis TaxID=1448857 RepID=A0A7M1LKB2_9BACT|nr:ABC transporter ATP-binding protein [Campylobacter corcagiensis]QOQ87975.1 ABC transporter ATP-binding protein [Campylobacter corcagiensis]
MIEVKNLKFFYSKKVILNGINFNLKSGENLAILGENGSGKSTLLKCMLNLLPYSGEILLNGKNIKSIKRKDLSKQIAYIPQSQNLPFEYEVIDIVLMSRISHKSFLKITLKKIMKFARTLLKN